MVRSILAVVVGYLSMAVLVVMSFLIVGMFLPESIKNQQEIIGRPEILVPLLVLNFIFAGVGGWVTAWIAHQNPMKHIFILCGLMLFLGILSAFGNSGAPLWYNSTVIMIGLAGVYVGARIRLKKA